VHADAVQQRRYEGSIIEARRYERVPQLRVLLLQAKLNSSFDVAHAAQQQMHQHHMIQQQIVPHGLVAGSPILTFPFTNTHNHAQSTDDFFDLVPSVSSRNDHANNFEIDFFCSEI
jgi:hypothetical protein